MRLGRQRVSDELAAATGVVFLAGSDTPVGTGFCISPDGIILSAGHLFTGKQHYEIKLKNLPQRLPLSMLDSAYTQANGTDYAVLKAKWSAPLPFLAVVPSERCDGQTIQRGYPANFNEQTTGEGSFLGNIDVDDRKALRLFHFSSSQSGATGFSGSGIYSYARGGVVAIQTEGAKNATGPLSSSVLAFPIFRIAKELPISGWTRFKWWKRSRIRSFGENLPVLALGACVVVAIAWTSIVGLSYVYSLQKQMDALSGERFHELSAAESTFWLSAPGRSFVEAHQGRNSRWHDDINAFLLNHQPIHETVLALAEMYEEAASCAAGSFCFRQSACVELYPQIWDFYHMYQGVWQAFNDSYRKRNDAKMEYFLKNYCKPQHEEHCKAAPASPMCKR